MGLLDSILGAVTGKTDGSGGAAQLIGVLGGVLAQSGGLQGLANKFAQSGQGNAFQSWVGMGENQAISSDQIQTALGSRSGQSARSKNGNRSRSSIELPGRISAEDRRQANTSWKNRSRCGPSAGTGGFAAIALAKPWWPIFDRRPSARITSAGCSVGPYRSATSTCRN